MENENKTITKQLEELSSEICDNYCKWPYVYKAQDKREDELLTEKCNFCPLANKL